MSYVTFTNSLKQLLVKNPTQFGLIVSLQDSTVLLVNGAWDGISTILESVAAYFILGERFDNYLQYIGLIFIVIGLYLLKIPLNKKHPFHIPKI
jgi:drug/metabolite transporter (DMT)-like permease